jgi:hypothetical protein
MPIRVQKIDAFAWTACAVKRFFVVKDGDLVRVKVNLKDFEMVRIFAIKQIIPRVA